MKNLEIKKTQKNGALEVKKEIFCKFDTSSGEDHKGELNMIFCGCAIAFLSTTSKWGMFSS